MIKVNANTFRGSISSVFILALSCEWESTLKRKSLLLLERFLPLKVDPVFGRNKLSTKANRKSRKLSPFVKWLVGCFGFNGPLRQYFSLYRAVSQREGERGERIDESKNVQTTPTRTYCKRNRPLPYCNQNCRTPRHWKFTQHHRTTRPPPPLCKMGENIEVYKQSLSL